MVTENAENISLPLIMLRLQDPLRLFEICGTGGRTCAILQIPLNFVFGRRDQPKFDENEYSTHTVAAEADLSPFDADRLLAPLKQEVISTMVNRINPDLNRPFESKLALNARRDPTAQNPNDDVIASLAKMPENRRARQVSEWETMRRRTFKLSL